MWKHEIVEYLRSATPEKNIERWRLLADWVETAHTFYFGEEEQFDDTLKKREGEKYEPYINTPFYITLYEWSESRKIKIIPGEQIRAPKRAVLVVNYEGGMQASYSFYMAEIDTSNINQFSQFGITKNSWAVSLTSSVYLPEENRLRWTDWAGVDLYENFGDECVMACIRDAGRDIGMTRLYTEILNCQNIITKEVTPPEKLNRKRIRNGRLPLYSYKILEVVKGKPKTKNAGSVPWDYKSPETVRFHLCRGHFKTFTEERPLFGKYSGTFWWNPQSRGDRSKGVVEKEYKVTTAKGAQGEIKSQI